MRLYSVIKSNSRLALKGSRGRATALMLLLLGVYAVLSAMQQAALSVFAPPAAQAPAPPADRSREAILKYISEAFVPAEWVVSAVYVAFTVLLLAPLVLGCCRWYYSLVSGGKQPFTDVFCYFESGRRYGRAVLYEININVRTALWSMLFFTLPGVLFAYCGLALSVPEANEARNMAAGLGVLLATALFIPCAVFYAACVMRYALAPYLLAQDDELTARQALKASVRYTRGYRFSLLWFGLSYYWWILLGIFALGVVTALPFFGAFTDFVKGLAGFGIFALTAVGMFYYWPLYSSGLAMFARYIIEKKRGEFAREENQDQDTREFSAPVSTEEPQEEETPQAETPQAEAPPEDPEQEETPEPPPVQETESQDNLWNLLMQEEKPPAEEATEAPEEKTEE